LDVGTVLTAIKEPISDQLRATVSKDQAKVLLDQYLWPNDRFRVGSARECLAEQGGSGQSPSVLGALLKINSPRSRPASDIPREMASRRRHHQAAAMAAPVIVASHP
jgi:hypothetical protein